MNDLEVKNYINILHEELPYTEVPLTYFAIYTDTTDEMKIKLKDIFAYWHYRINQRLEMLNGYVKKKYTYFHANESRELNSLIVDVFAFIENFRNTLYEVTLDSEYDSVFRNCQSFLRSGGSTIPENLNIIPLLYRPIFTFANSMIETSNHNQYELKHIGGGAYADVFKYYDTDYSCLFALKRLKKDVTDKDKQRFEKEYQLMKENCYPYITTVYGFNKLGNYYTMEYCPYNLDKFISVNNTKLSFSQRKSIALQFLKGLNYLHNKGILHRDLSFRNILIHPFEDLILVKISDFGLAKDSNESMTSVDSSMKGTLLDPCLESFQHYDIQNEMYSIGFILWFIFTGKKNFKAQNTAISTIVSQCISSDKKSRYANVNKIISEVSRITKIDDAPLIQSSININELKNRIIAELTSFSANMLPDVCVSIGLTKGTVEEAFKSKSNYISQRLYKLDRAACLIIIEKMKNQLGIEINSTT